MQPGHKGTGNVSDVMSSWLRRELRLVDPLSSASISGGWSNITYAVTDGVGRRVVIRRPPAGHRGGGAHDVLREAMIVDALRGTAVPVPVVVGRCADESVAGFPFYVMDYLPATVVGSVTVARQVAPPARRDLGLELVDVLADLQVVDIDAAGLSSLRRSTPYLRRQLRRWTEQWRAVATRSVPNIDAVAHRLECALGAIPDTPDVLVHGDYRFGNVMIDNFERPRIAAVLDWELTTTGHPLADLGFVGARLHAPDGVLEGGRDPGAIDGFPSFAQLCARFEARTGCSARDIAVFVALSAWRWAIIVEGIQRRISRGVMDAGMGGGLANDAGWHRHRVELLAAFAADLLE